jgi:hypothetical protein
MCGLYNAGADISFTCMLITVGHYNYEVKCILANYCPFRGLELMSVNFFPKGGKRFCRIFIRREKKKVKCSAAFVLVIGADTT